MRQWQVLGALGVISIVVFSLVFSGCQAAGHRGTAVLYDKPDNKRLPEEKVARLLMGELRGFGKRLAVRVDSRQVRLRDTLEVLPGEHVIRLRLTQSVPHPNPRQSSPYGYRPNSYHPQYYLYSTYLSFRWPAKAGHEYECKLVEYSLKDWQVVLVDTQDPSEVVCGEELRGDKLDLSQPDF